MTFFQNLPDTQKVLLLTTTLHQSEEQLEMLKHLLTKDIDWDFISKYAVQHGTASLLYKCIKKNSLQDLLPESVYFFFKGVYIQTYSKNSFAVDALCEILKRFNAAGIDTVLFKGMAFTGFVYNDYGLRPMGDIDIMVRPEKLLEAEALMLDMGFIYETPYKSQKMRTLNIHNHLNAFVRNNIKVELHWGLSAIHHIHRMPSNYVWQNLEEVSFENQKAYTLNTLSNIQYLCLHAISHFQKHKIRLNIFADIAVFLKMNAQKIDWENLAVLINSFNNGQPVYQVLHIIRHFFDIKIPESFLKKIDPNIQTLEIDFEALLFNNIDNITYKMPSNYVKKVRKIEGFKNKILYLWVETFPSRTYMAYNYNLKNKNAVYPYYFVQFYKQLRKTIFNLFKI